MQASKASSFSVILLKPMTEILFLALVLYIVFFQLLTSVAYMLAEVLVPQTGISGVLIMNSCVITH